MRHRFIVSKKGTNMYLFLSLPIYEASILWNLWKNASFLCIFWNLYPSTRDQERTPKKEAKDLSVIEVEPRRHRTPPKSSISLYRAHASNPTPPCVCWCDDVMMWWCECVMMWMLECVNVWCVMMWMCECVNVDVNVWMCDDVNVWMCECVNVWWCECVMMWKIIDFD